MPLSPRIEKFSWGKIVVEGGAIYKDAKLFPGGSREWNWNETGTNHEDGIQPADVDELIKNGAKTIIFGCGVYERLEVNEITKKY